MLIQTPPDMSKVSGGWIPDSELEQPFILHCKRAPVTTELISGAHLVKYFIDNNSVDNINNFMFNAPELAPVSIQGLQEITEDTIGSHRTTMWNPILADKFDKLIKNTSHPYYGLPLKMECNELTATDWWQGNKNRKKWEYYGVSPMLRYMKYSNQGQHFCHYDAGFQYPDDNYRTLKSFVLYLSTNNSGATRFIQDNQYNIPVWDRKHEDWDRPAKDNEVLIESLPVKGSLLIFNHRLAHDVSVFSPEDENETRIIIRGDLIYSASQNN